MTPGALYVVATPIGNLGDISRRAVEVLARVDLVAAEDTRRTRQLLSHLGLGARLVAIHGHNERQRLGKVLAALQEGRDIALVSDGGTPLISDPGAALVAAATAAGVPVIPVPGACAAITALTVAGLPTDRFCFVGFLPRTPGKADAALADLAAWTGSLVFYESPRRVGVLLERLRRQLGDRPAAVCRELTKRHEEVVRGRLSELAVWAAAGVRGEVVVVVGGAAGAAAPAEVDEDAIEAALAEGRRAREIARDLAARSGLSSQEAYGKVQEVKRRLMSQHVALDREPG